VVWCGGVVHGNLTGANIAPESGEWALDSGGCGVGCARGSRQSDPAPILRRRAVNGGWIRVGVAWGARVVHGNLTRRQYCAGGR
jgi:hypothetical protein